MSNDKSIEIINFPRQTHIYYDVSIFRFVLFERFSNRFCLFICIEIKVSDWVVDIVLN